MARRTLPPQHALFVRYGKFQLGAVGRPAVFAVVILVVAGVIGSNAWVLW